MNDNGKLHEEIVKALRPDGNCVKIDWHISREEDERIVEKQLLEGLKRLGWSPKPQLFTDPGAVNKRYSSK